MEWPVSHTASTRAFMTKASLEMEGQRRLARLSRPGNQTQLLHLIVGIHHHPSFDHLAIYDAIDHDSCHPHLFASWAVALKHPMVGSLD